METENTSTATETPAPTVTTATEAQTTTPANATTTATAAPDLKGLSKDAHKAAVAASISAKRASAATSAEKPATANPGPSSEAAEVAKEPDATAKPTEDEMELEAARRLNEIALSGKRMRAKIVQEQQEAATNAAAREKEFAEREARLKAEAARVEAISKAKAGGKKLDVLRAAGYTEEEIRGQFFLDAMKELNDEPDAPASAAMPKDVLTKEEAMALIKAEREAAAEAERQRIADQQAAQLKAQQDQYFSGLAQEFNKGDFPILKALPVNLRPTHAQMHDYLIQHYNTTGESLRAVALLQKIENEYKDAGFAPPAKKDKSAPKPPAATTRTITPTATSDAGDQVPPPESRKDRPWREVRQEGFEKWKASRTGNGRQ